jgi:3',5'-cyclic AMP phosphodiesterase CpdA
MMTLLAQITDSHIREPGRLAYRRLNTAPYLSSAVNALMKLPQKPNALVLTGDLTDFGRESEYKHLADLLSPLDIPYYLLPGNHDDRDNMRSSFPSHTYLGVNDFIQYSIYIGDLRLVALDSSEPGQSAGRLCKARLTWLEKELERDQASPTVIAIHHPPFKTLIGHMDKIGLLEGAGELEAIVSRHPNIHRVISGHLHRSIFTNFGGTVASTAPGPAHQVCLDLKEDAVSAWTMEPPGFQLHAWDGVGSLLTHSVSIGAFEGPYPFHENGVLID